MLFTALKEMSASVNAFDLAQDEQDRSVYRADERNIFLPYYGRIPQSRTLTVGTKVIVHGKSLPDADTFSINLVTSAAPFKSNNCLMHFNPRFNKSTVVRNNLVNGCWNTEEKNGGFPFKKGEPFEVVIAVEEPGYRIFVNKKRFCDFRHRDKKFSAVQYIFIAGDVFISSLELYYPDEGKAHQKGTKIVQDSQSQDGKIREPEDNPPSLSFKGQMVSQEGMSGQELAFQKVHSTESKRTQ